MSNKDHTQFALLCLVAVVSTFLLHEFSHWLIGEILGYDMAMNLNAAFPINGEYRTGKDYAIISSAGPIVTILEMIIFVILIKATINYRYFPFIFICFYMALLSGIMNIFNYNDLGRISRYLNLGTFALPIISIILHGIVLTFAYNSSGISRKRFLVTIFWCMLFSSILILLNQSIKFQIL